MKDDKKSYIRLAGDKGKGVVSESIVDGKGLRLVIFCQGCKHNCKGCFNKETHSFDGGYDEEIENIINQIKNDPLIDGVTFSGGDCFEQADKCAKIAEAISGIGLNIWAYTGYEFEYIVQNMNDKKGWPEFIKSIDVLVDGKFELDNKDLTLSFKGSSNQRIIDVKKSFEQGEVILIEEI